MGKIILLSAKATRGSRNDPVEGCKLVQISFLKRLASCLLQKLFHFATYILMKCVRKLSTRPYQRVGVGN